ncbi:hypothetical protein ACFQ9J_33505 [Streptomyces sp. NPDC056529]|uniref:hypothetical protein n=1 Tax=Streptomyces sp. NPDC056529 TaxID=3345855 RepID=UPI0036845043
MVSAYAEREGRMRDRLGGRECLCPPSCRLGLHLALRHWCAPGGRVLMSPVNDDVILFVVLAAGLRPVQAPLDPRDGRPRLRLERPLRRPHDPRADSAHPADPPVFP